MKFARWRDFNACGAAARLGAGPPRRRIEITPAKIICDFRTYMHVCIYMYIWMLFLPRTSTAGALVRYIAQHFLWGGHFGVSQHVSSFSRFGHLISFLSDECDCVGVHLSGRFMVLTAADLV